VDGYVMARRDPSRGHRFPKDVILLAVRWYCRYPLSYRDVRDMLAERGIMVDAASIYRWVRKFAPEIRKRALSRHRSWRGLTWHVDETYIRVNGRWCYLWRAVDQYGQLIDFRLTARRDAKAARAFLRQARETVRLYQPLTIITDKAPTYVKVISQINDRPGSRRECCGNSLAARSKHVKGRFFRRRGQGASAGGVEGGSRIRRPCASGSGRKRATPRAASARSRRRAARSGS